MRTTPKDFFLHLGVIITLYVSIISFLTLIFRVVDYAFPPAFERYFATSAISWPVASLIIIFPIYLILSWILNRDYVANPEKRDLGIRRWLLYITLFIAGIAIVTDLIVLLYYFLDGRLITAGFILKVLAVFVVAGGVFSYYILDLRERTNRGVNKLFAVIAALLAIGSIVAGFAVIGSPQTQRQLRYDQQKVQDLQMIQGQVLEYWNRTDKLPETLAEVDDILAGFNIPEDPQSQPYEYRKIANLNFELCATFNLPSNEGKNKRAIPEPIYGPYGLVDEDWKHSDGRSCFERTIRPELFPDKPQKAQ
ncbi:MAG: DUF5671 domain-containing protein [bacterium]|nr:DUF5671 domain-containing protein [bacterium]